MDLATAVDRYIAAIESAGYSRHTIKAYSNRLSDLCRFCGDGAQAALEPEMVQAYLASLRSRPIGRRSGVAASTIAHAHAVFSGFYSYLERVLRIEPNPMRDVIKPRGETSVDDEFHSLTVEQLEQLLHVSRNGWHGPPADLRSPNRQLEDYLVVGLMGLAGLRVSEVCSIDRSDIVDDVACILGKGRKRRRVPLAPDLLAALERYEPPARVAHLFGMPTDRSRRLTPNAVEQRVPRLARRAGIVELRVTPHTLRHTFGSLMLAADPTALVPTRDLMGHESVETTNKYAHTRDEARRMALTSFHELRAKNKR